MCGHNSRQLTNRNNVDPSDSEIGIPIAALALSQAILMLATKEILGQKRIGWAKALSVWQDMVILKAWF